MAKKKAKGTGAKKAGKAPAAKGGKVSPKEAAAPKAAGPKKRIFVTLQVLCGELRGVSILQPRGCFGPEFEGRPLSPQLGLSLAGPPST